MANLSQDFYLIHNLDLLFDVCTKLKPLDDKKYKIPAFLYLIVHNEFYISMSSFMRRHQSKSFLSLRLAIDSALTAYYLLKNPDQESVYLSGVKALVSGERNKEWNRIFLNIKKTIKNDLDKFPLAKKLTEAHEHCSLYAHSDPCGILHKYHIDEVNLILQAKYFDYEKLPGADRQRLAYILYKFLRVFLIFWHEMFQARADEKMGEINNQLELFKKNLGVFAKKYRHMETEID